MVDKKQDLDTDVPARAFYEDYVASYDDYTEAAAVYKELLQLLLERSGSVGFDLKVRPKNPLSLYKKQQDKKYKDPWNDFSDLIGARITVGLSSEKADVIKLLRDFEQVEVLEIDDKELTRDPQKLLYSGLHAQIRKPGLINRLGIPISCEVQIRTTAEHTWAETEHKYIYKGPEGVPNETRRIFSRLLALIELLDEQLVLGVKNVSELESFARLQLAQKLESYFQTIYTGPFSSKMTHEAVALIDSSGLYTIEDLVRLVSDYLDGNGPFIKSLFAAHGPESPSFDVDNDIVMSQPESLMYLAILDDNAYGLGVTLRDTDLYHAVRPLALWSNSRGYFT